MCGRVVGSLMGEGFSCVYRLQYTQILVTLQLHIYLLQYG